MYPSRVSLFGIQIDPLTMSQTVQKTKELLQDGKFAHLIGVNADKVLQILDDPLMAEIVSGCEIVNADGASMVLAAKRLGVYLPERVAGIDLMIQLCEMAQTEGKRVYLLGAKEEVVKTTAEVLRKQFPQLNICGLRDGYFQDSEFDNIAKQVADCSPDIVFVGITSPKKEMLIEHFRSLGLRGAYVGVGGSFDVISGNIPRAPQWMQKANLEWLFRMVKEPKRLVKRYVVGNMKFLFLLTKEIVHKA